MNFETTYKDLIENNGTSATQSGTVIFDADFNVVYFDRIVAASFKDDKILTADKFGSIFKCDYIATSNKPCGTKRQCRNCKLNNSLVTSRDQFRSIDGLKFNKTFAGEDKVDKWFNLDIFPFKIDGQVYIHMTMIDQTEIIQNEIEIEMEKILMNL